MSLKKEVTFSLRDQLFNKEKVLYLADLFGSGFVFYGYDFDKKSFCRDCLVDFSNLELKQRISHITDIIHKYFVSSNILDYDIVIKILIKSLPDELDNKKEDDDFGDFILAPFGEYISKYGLEKQYLSTSFEALYQITKRFSVEFAMRSFINTFPSQSLKILEKWSKDKNYHVRRLTSESLRQKLPWAIKIDVDYKDETIMRILNNLSKDQTMYVRRSVANHLHDISKIDLDFVLNILKGWKDSKNINPIYLDFIIRHSLRTVIKNGDKKALEFVNIKHNPNVKIQNFVLTNKSLYVPGYLEFSFDIVSLENSKTEYEFKYIIYFRNSRSIDYDLETFSKKVFNLKSISLSKDELYKVCKKHLIKSMTTRTLYKGKQFLEISANGKSLYIVDFGIRF